MAAAASSLALLNNILYTQHIIHIYIWHVSFRRIRRKFDFRLLRRVRRCGGEGEKCTRKHMRAHAHYTHIGRDDDGRHMHTVVASRRRRRRRRVCKSPEGQHIYI